MAKSFSVKVVEKTQIDEETAEVRLRITQPKNLDKLLKTWDMLEAADDMIEVAFMLYLLWRKK